jgi:two-component system sensor histidine kinase MprB
VSLRWQIALAMAAVTVFATAVIGALSYAQTRERLIAEVDRSLVAVDQPLEARRLDLDALPDRGPLSSLFVQVARGDGVVRDSTFPVDIPVTDADLAVASRPRASAIRTVETDAGDYRVRSVGIRSGVIQIGRSLDETDRVLRGLRARLMVWVVAVAAAAIAIGLLIAGRITRSLRRLTHAAEQVEATGRLDVVVDDDATDDEVGRLGAAFDRMLAALRRSQEQQHRLVQDAGHELRTPLTSLRTNLDTLRRHPELDATQRDAIVDDLHAETEELTNLVDEIVSVASGATAREPAETFDLAEVVREVAERYERRTGRPIVVVSEPGTVVAERNAVQRAVSCLLDNAGKFDVSGGSIDVDVGCGEVRVSDRGPGIPAAEREAVFERFHRADDARSLPGSGLGLSIVREVARRHGGEAFVEARRGGGAVVGFRLGPTPS